MDSLEQWEEEISIELGLLIEQREVLIEVGGPRFINGVIANHILVSV